MIDFFDTLGNTLNDIIGEPTNNTVGWGHGEVFGYAEGGIVGDDTSSSGLAGFINSLGNAAKQTMNKQDTSYLGGGFYNSPAYLTSHFTSLGKFFNPGNPMDANSNRFGPSEKAKPVQTVDPNDFYARWYMSLRRFAEAKEVANAGAATIRPKD